MSLKSWDLSVAVLLLLWLTVVVGAPTPAAEPTILDAHLHRLIDRDNIPTGTSTSASTITAPPSSSTRTYDCNSPVTTGSDSGWSRIFSQCGGSGYTGPTSCGGCLYCYSILPTFYQCLGAGYPYPTVFPTPASN
ncbi:hypothetical protein BDZ91DRAFT_708150 [Kalaharituber pfeilii]|nr:hypothetical protein BDZ91DRAFT_786466 [Kalaharituber pfeilii]KAF8476814.1 hypothetical protein BDZ91DRAFT_708150 [Kalaharituber pfeilii]